MPSAPGIQDELVDRFASQIYGRMTKADAAAIGIEDDDLENWERSVWERASPAMHALFRARAERMIAGDLSVLPPTWPIGTAPHLAATANQSRT